MAIRPFKGPDGLLRRGDDQDFPMQRMQFDLECSPATRDRTMVMARLRYRDEDWCICTPPTTDCFDRRRLHQAVLTCIAARNPIAP